MVSQLMEKWNEKIKALEATVGFTPYFSVDEIKFDFIGKKEEYCESDLQAVRYRVFSQENDSTKRTVLEIHESFLKVAEELIEREAIRSFIPPAINSNPMVIYFIHTSIPSSEYLWTKLLEQLRERYIEYIQQNTELKIGMIRKETSIQFDRGQMLRLLRELNIQSPKRLVQLFFWRTMFLSTSTQTLEFREAVIFKQLLTYMTPKQFGYGFKQIKEEVVEQQRFIRIPKKEFEVVLPSLIDKLDFRRSLSLNWSITNMCRYLVLLELSPRFIASYAEYFDYFVKPLRLLATVSISHCTLCIIYADVRDINASYLRYLDGLKKHALILNYQAFLVDSYENRINLNYFNHPNLRASVLTEDVITSGPLQSEYAQYVSSIDPNHRATKKEEIRSLFEFLRYSQIQSDTYYPEISFRKFIEQLSVADICILFLCIMNHTIRPFTLFPVDKQSLELIQAGITDSIRIYKRLATRKEEFTRYLNRYPSLNGALIEFLLLNLETLKKDIVHYFDHEHVHEHEVKKRQQFFSIAQFLEWLQNRRSSYPLFMHEHPDIMDTVRTLLVDQISVPQKEVTPVSKRIDRLFNEEFGDLVKWLGQLSRTGISIVHGQAVESAAKRIALLETASEGLKAYLRLEKPQFEQKISELIQYAGEMRAVDVNVFRSTLFAKDVVYLIVKRDESDARVSQLRTLFLYNVRYNMSAQGDNGTYLYFRIHIPSTIQSELLRRFYAVWSKRELVFLSDSSSLHLLSSLTTTDLLMKLSNPPDELDSLLAFASRERSWISSREPPTIAELSRAQKETLNQLQKSIDSQHEVVIKKRGLKDLLSTSYPSHPVKSSIPKEIIHLVKTPKKLLEARINVSEIVKEAVKAVSVNIIPSQLQLQKAVLIIRSTSIDLYPDRICQSDLGILFGPGLHSIRYGSSGAANWLIVHYYLPLGYESVSQGFKKVFDILEEYPSLSFDFLRVDSEAGYYNFDLYLDGHWVNLDFVVESKLQLTSRDFEYLKPHLADVPLNDPMPLSLSSEELNCLLRFQNSEFDTRIGMLAEIGALIPNKARLDIELIPEAFDFRHSFAILAFASDLSVLEKVKIVCRSFPKSRHFSVVTMRSGSGPTRPKHGVLIVVDCGVYSIRYTVYGLISYLKKLGCDSIEVFTGLADPIIIERSISFFKNKSWTAWFPSSSLSISFFPLNGRYAFRFDSEDLMSLYTLADQMNVFTAGDYEQRMRLLRHAFTELKKAGKKPTMSAIEALMEEAAVLNGGEQ